MKEFLLSIQHQSALTHLNENLNMSSSSPSNSILDFSGICRLDLKVRISFFTVQFVISSKGMNEISTKTTEYHSLEILLTQKNPSIRFQQHREREMKELSDLQSIPASQQLQPIVPEKSANTNEKFRSGSSLKMTGQSLDHIHGFSFRFFLAQRPSSRLKE